jgi:hypothetical protein
MSRVMSGTEQKKTKEKSLGGISETPLLPFRGSSVSGMYVCMYLFIRGDFKNKGLNEGLAETSRIFLRDAHVLPKLLSYEEYCRRDMW